MDLGVLHERNARRGITSCTRHEDVRNRWRVRDNENCVLWALEKPPKPGRIASDELPSLLAPPGGSVAESLASSERRHRESRDAGRS
jgi:hypothetical protein